MKKYDLRQILESYYSGGGARDERTGLGYGLTRARFHTPRSEAGSFPYDDADEYEDIEPHDEEDLYTIRRKTPAYLPSDVLPKKGPNPVYFAESATKLSDCFWMTDEVLAEIAAFGDSMVSIPHVSGGRGNTVSGGTSSASYAGAGGSNFKRTGTLRGWSQSPPPSIATTEELFDEEIEDEYIYSLQDLAKK